jgi:hypothetical protein
MIGGSGIARYAKAELETSFADAIGLLNSRLDAPAQLTVPETFYLYGERNGAMPDLAVLGVAVEVSVPDIDLDELDMAAQAADGRALLQVTVWATDGGLDFPDLIDRLHLYGSAVVSVLSKPGWAPGQVTRNAAIRVRAADVDPDAADGTNIEAAAAVILYVEYDEVLAL